jgi:hypothetical protein
MPTIRVIVNDKSMGDNFEGKKGGWCSWLW